MCMMIHLTAGDMSRRTAQGLFWRRRSRAGAVAEAVEGHVARLVGGEAGALLARCGLAEIAERVRCARQGFLGFSSPVMWDPPSAA